MPCDYSKYPADWKERRARILTRARHRCEQCGLPNYAVGYRTDKGSFIPLAGNLICDAAGRGRDAENGYRLLTPSKAREFVEHYNDCGAGRLACDGSGNRWFFVVLTIAHLDHDATNHAVADERLAALCQQCHNRLDMKERARRRAGLANLFE